MSQRLCKTTQSRLVLIDLSVWKCLDFEHVSSVDIVGTLWYANRIPYVVRFQQL
jgi:hypothetical protein